MYRNDTLWARTKQYAKANGFSEDWASIIDVYYSEGGTDVEVYCIIEDSRYRIVGIEDAGDVILLSKTEELSTHKHSEVLESQKFFYYRENDKIATLELPENCKYLGKQWMNIPVSEV